MADLDDLGEDFGQEEEFTSRLKNLLKEYPDGLSIPKELVQNSDDAGADETCLLLDLCNYKTDKLANPGLGLYQGPALYFYNNKPFKECDFHNLCKFGGATKLEDRSKVGKFGLGFNGVYNITDIPQFVSGNHLCILDPHEFFYRRRGKKFNLSDKNVAEILADQVGTFENIFGFSSERIVQGEPFNGTIFRFPLRTVEHAKRSKIRPGIPYTADDALDLINRLVEFGHLFILFTQFVGKMKIMVRRRLDEEFEVLADFSRKVVDIQSGVDCSDKCQVLFGESNKFKNCYKVSVKNKNKQEDQNWAVAAVAPGKTAEDKTRCVGSVALCLNSCDPDSKHLLFCFLPIPDPLNTYLPFMINGTFAVNSSRRQIQVQTMDDRSTEGEWNETIMNEAVSHALVFAIISISTNDPSVDIFRFFPCVAITQSYISLVVKNFYLQITKDKEASFFPTSKGGKTSLCASNLRIISPAEKSSSTDEFIPETVRQSLLTCIQPRIRKNLEGWSEEYPITIPHFLYDMLAEHAPAFLSRRLMKFTPCFNKLLEVLSRENFNNALPSLLYALDNSTYLKLQTVLNNRAWIATAGTKDLKQPCEFVSPDTKLSGILSFTNEYSPHECMNFNASRIQLCQKLGMQMIILPIGALRKVMKDLYATSNYATVHSKLLKIVEHLNANGHVYAKRLDEWGDFKIPVSKKNGAVSWENCENCYPHEYKTLLSHTTCKMIDFKNLGISKDSYVDNIFKIWKVPSCDLVLRSFQSLISDEAIEFNKKATASFFTFKFFGQSKNSLVSVKTTLQKMHCIATTLDKFVNPSDVALTGCCVLDNFLFVVHPSLQQRDIRNFLLSLGASENFNKDTYVSCMTKLSNFEVSDSQVTQLVEILKYLKSNSVQARDLCIPDKTRKMRSAESLCFEEEDDDEDDDESAQQDMICHSEIPRKLGSYFGVQTRRALQLSRLTDTSIFEPFGQQEKLTNRLKTILEGYSEGIDLFKEMLQNADDAGATVCDFILDLRTLRKEKIVDEGWCVMQDPALIVYNDAPFTTEDLKGIQMLGTGSKRNDLLKIGQFGVGFNCVYKITDTPIFLTQLDGEGDGRLCLLDPSFSVVNNSSPGCCVKLNSQFVRKNRDTFEGFLPETFNVSSGGTMFRLPLRKTPSDISSHIPTAKTLNDQFNQLGEMLSTLILFLNSVSSIGIFVIDRDGNRMETRRVTKEVMEKYRPEHEAFKSMVLQSVKSLTAENHKFDTHRQQVFYNIMITDTALAVKQKWTIVEQYGSTRKLPNEVVLAIKSGDLRVKPHGSIAIRHDVKHKYSAVYCYLPIPEATWAIQKDTVKIPVCVNGQFYLDHSRRFIQLNDIQGQWNRYVLQSIVAQCYSHLVYKASQQLSSVTGSKIRAFLDYLPESTEHTFSDISLAFIICRGLFVDLSQHNTAYVPILSIDGQILGVATQLEALNFMNTSYEKEVYIFGMGIGLKLTQLPPRFFNFWNKCGASIQSADPNHFFDVLNRTIQTPVRIEQTAFRNIEVLMSILWFSKDFITSLKQEANKLPIFLSDSGMLYRNNTADKLYSNRHKISTIFPQLASQILNNKVENFLGELNVGCQLDVSEIPRKLEQCFPQLCQGRIIEYFQNSQGIPEKPKQWLYLLWHLLSTKVEQSFSTNMVGFNSYLVQMDNISILPCINSNKEPVLVPLSMRKSRVFPATSVPVKIGLVDIKPGQFSCFYTLDEEMIKENSRNIQALFSSSKEIQLLRKIIVNDEKLTNVDFALELLFEIHKCGRMNAFDDKQRQKLIEYFAHTLKGSWQHTGKTREILRELPLHLTLDGKYESLGAENDTSKKCYCVSAEIPREGCFEVASSVGYRYFTKYDIDFQQKLGVIHQQDEQVYLEFIIPFKFGNFEEELLKKHLGFLDKYYSGSSSSSSQAKLALSKALSNCPFVQIKSPDGEIIRAKPVQLFDPKIPLFTLFVDKTNLLPDEYLRSFKSLFSHLSVINKISDSYFLTFARKHAANCIVSNPTAVNSSLLENLMKILKENEDFSTAVIKEFSKLSIFPSIENKFIPSENSFLRTHWMMIGKVAPVMGSNGSFMISKLSKGMQKKLKIRDEVSVSLVFDNIVKTVSLAEELIKKREDNKISAVASKTPYEDNESYTINEQYDMLVQCLKFVQQQPNSSYEVIRKIKNLRCIPNKIDKFLAPQQICKVVNSSNPLISRYISDPNDKFLMIWKEMEGFGASAQPAAQQLIFGLQQLNTDLRNSQNPNLTELAQEMVFSLYRSLHRDGQPNDLEVENGLFLYTVGNALYPSSTGVYKDADSKKITVKLNLVKDLLISLKDPKEELDKQKIENVLEKLPLAVRPKKLSEIVSRKIAPETFKTENQDESFNCDGLRGLFSSPDFREPFSRYIKYSLLTEKQQEVSDEVINKLLTHLQKKRYLSVKKLVVLHESTLPELMGPQRDDARFVVDNDLLVFCVEMYEQIADLHSDISTELFNDVEPVISLRARDAVSKMIFIHKTREERMRFIKPTCGDVFEEEDETDGRLPQPGDEVPFDLHAAVDQNIFECLEIESLVAHLVSCDLRNPIYKLARVKDLVRQPEFSAISPFFGLYRVEIKTGESGVVEMSGINLFKFREPSRSNQTEPIEIGKTSTVDDDMKNTAQLYLAMTNNTDKNIQASQSELDNVKVRLLNGLLAKYPDDAEAQTKLITQLNTLYTNASHLRKEQEESSDEDRDGEECEIASSIDVLFIDEVQSYLMSRNVEMQKEHKEYEKHVKEYEGSRSYCYIPRSTRSFSAGNSSVGSSKSLSSSSSTVRSATLVPQVPMKVKSVRHPGKAKIWMEHALTDLNAMKRWRSDDRMHELLDWISQAAIQACENSLGAIILIGSGDHDFSVEQTRLENLLHMIRKLPSDVPNELKVEVVKLTAHMRPITLGYPCKSSIDCPGAGVSMETVEQMAGIAEKITTAAQEYLFKHKYTIDDH